MILADRFLVALGDYLAAQSSIDLTPRLRDWEGQLGAVDLILEAETPEEHEIMLGSFALDGALVLRFHRRDFSEEERRSMAQAVVVALSETLPEDDGLHPQNRRRVFVDALNEGDHDFMIEDFRHDGGTWGEDDDLLMGKIEFGAMIREA